MADVTVFAPPPIVVTVVSGSPPEDQSALVAQLQADNAALVQANTDLTQQVAALRTF